MKTKSKSGSMLILATAAAAALLGATTLLSAPAVKAEDAVPHDVTACNCELGGAGVDYSSPVTVGYTAPLRGATAYRLTRGFRGAAWIIGDASGYVDYGTGSASDRQQCRRQPRDLSLTLSVDSETAGDAYLFLWAETISEETFTLQVNEGEGTGHRALRRRISRRIYDLG